MKSLARLPAENVEVYELDHWIPYQCSIITNRASSMLKRMYAEELGIGVVEWRLLANLAAHAPLSAKELAVHTAMDQVAITRAVTTLVKKKLVTRRQDAIDRRKVVLRLSKSGVTAHAAVLPLVQAIESELTTGMSGEQLVLLRKLLDLLVDASNKTLAVDRDWRDLIQQQASVHKRRR